MSNIFYSSYSRQACLRFFLGTPGTGLLGPFNLRPIGILWDGTFDTPTLLTGSLPHDVGYQILREELILHPIDFENCMDNYHAAFIAVRLNWDKTLDYVCKKAGMGGSIIRSWFGLKTLRRKNIYFWVRVKGKIHAMPRSLKQYLSV